MPVHTRTGTALLTLFVLLAQHAAAAPVRVAIVGGGIGGTAAAYFLQQLQPTWQIELFERERIGGRTEELFLDGRTLELGASIIHAQNHYVLSLAKELGLTPVQGDDTGDAFSIFDGRSFVFSQGRSQVLDTLAVLRRYGISPLRYKWLAEEMGQRFSRIYDLQGAGRAFQTPQQLWEALELFNVTQQSAADYMQAHLSRGMFRYGAAAFAEQLAGAVNRINYNQRNQGMNALAGLVSYLPAAQPEVYSIQEGNAALPRKLAAAAELQALHIGTAVQAVQRDAATGQYTLLAVQPTPSPSSANDASTSTKQDSATRTGASHQHKGAFHEAADLVFGEVFGPFDGAVLATPLEGSGIDLQGVLPSGTVLPKREYQSTVTTYVTGMINPKYFKLSAMPAGDIFVTNSADTPFSVIASKGAVSNISSSSSCISRALTGCPAADGLEQHQAKEQQVKEQQEQHADKQQQQQQLWKVFSQEPLSEALLQQLFINGTVIISKAWKAYPQFHPPEVFAPFTLSPGLCYNNALENGASAMEVAAVAAMNCALLLQQQLGQKLAAEGGSERAETAEQVLQGSSNAAGVAVS